MSLIKVAWYVLIVKNMHSVSSSDPWGPRGKEKPSYVYYIIRQGKADLHTLKLTTVFHHLPSVGPIQLCALAHLVFTRKVDTSY